MGKISNANTLLFGIEEQRNKTTLKVYSEYWDHLVSLIRQGKHHRQPFALYHGYKWNPSNPALWLEDIYWCYPLLSIPEMHLRLEQLLEPDEAIFKHLLSPLIFQNPSLKGEQLIYLEIVGEKNSRQSFDINFYKSHTSVADALPHLFELAKKWYIKERVENALSGYYQQSLGHISGGVDHDKQPFLSIYIEESPAY